MSPGVGTDSRVAWGMDFNSTLEVGRSTFPKAVENKEKDLRITPKLNREAVQMEHGLFSGKGTAQNETGGSVLNSLAWFELGPREQIAPDLNKPV